MNLNILLETTLLTKIVLDYFSISNNEIKTTFFKENKIPKDLHKFDLIFISTFNINILKELKKSRGKIVFLLEDLKEIKKLDEQNINDFIIKPFTKDKFKVKINETNKVLKQDYSIKKEIKFSNLILNSSKNPIFLTNGKNVTLSNDIFNHLMGVNSTTQIAEKVKDISTIFLHLDDHISNKDKNWLEKCTKNSSNKCVIKNQKNEGFTYEISTTYLPQEKLYLVNLNNISSELDYKQKMLNLMYTDSLTNLLNRSKLIEDLKDNILNIQSLVILDLNSFKEINDFYGHKIGDLVLIEVTNRIQVLIKNYKNLNLYKLPSDTYCITNSSLDKKEFEEIVVNIIESINTKAFYFQQHELDLNIIAGISFSERNNKLVTADIALQTAKQKNKNYLVFYNELDNLEEYENNMLWTKKVKNALLNDNIIVYYQPLINNKKMSIDKFECLVRMVDEDKIISPYFFLDISKKSNQYKEISKVVIEKSFKEFSKLDFEFSVNISYEDIEDSKFLPYIKDMLNLYQVQNKVVFEILEDENIKDYNILIDFIDEVKKLGCKVAIDDFGTGYSNFEHLLKLNIDYLKIDASLVKNIATDENSLKITKTIIDFAKSLNLETIAEFVENKEIFYLVKELGADFSQGYYFSAPISNPEDINIKIETQNS